MQLPKFNQQWSKTDKVKRHLNNIKMKLEKSLQIKSTNPMALLDSVTNSEDSSVVNKSSSNQLKFARPEAFEEPIEEQVIHKLRRHEALVHKSYSNKASLLSTLGKNVRHPSQAAIE